MTCMRFIMCMAVSLMLFFQANIFSLILVAGWFSGRRMLKITSIVIAAIGYTVSILDGIILLS